MANRSPVLVRRELIRLPTYEPHRPDPNPMFLEKRVYQGSSGRVYPLPFIDRIAETATPQPWEAVFLENEYVRVMLLPQIGGRIHRIQDKTNGYDAIYHQPVIKPALVGLAGPWCSGGIEFNWPQHHRPSTFLPTDVAIEEHADGSATVWMSEHDPMARMKGMHGVRLHPSRSIVELVARVHNRTAEGQTFLWWANVATRVHEAYQSFFPPDVSYVADHAKRAMSTFPLCSDKYYGVDYATRARDGVPTTEIPRQFVPPHCLREQSQNPKPKSKIPDYPPADLSWYANIPVPTSYMCMGSSEDFCGGYDYQAEAGLMQVANHHIAPGKKQWTWGNHEFGYAWDRNLTEPDPATGEYPPYIELMAGVFTDNQPDFSFLQPGESRSWSQYWYPFRAIGPAQQANADAAVSLHVLPRRIRIGVAVTAAFAQAVIRLEKRGRILEEWTEDLAPDRPFVRNATIGRTAKTALALRVLTAEGRELIVHTPQQARKSDVPPPATEPLAPEDVATSDELFITGLHLEQYRHATRSPQLYWREALRRDRGDARCNLALGRWHLRRGELADAEKHLRASIARLTTRNPNPADGEPHYQLGLCLRQQAYAAAARGKSATIDAAKVTEAYAAFYKATWNQAWQSAGFHALAEIDALRGAWKTALAHLDESLKRNAENFRARCLRVIALRHLGEPSRAESFLRETLALDPLDWWARHLAGQPLTCDHQVRLDLALDYARAGLFDDAIALLDAIDAASAAEKSALSETRAPASDSSQANGRGTAVLPDQSLGTAPLIYYYLAWLTHLKGDTPNVQRHLLRAAKAPPEYCFPARLDEIAILEFATVSNPRDARAPFYLGNLLYDRRRHGEAIERWKRAAALEPANAVAWRNLGIGYFNICRDARRARQAYDRALRANPRDARLLYERDQLWKRLGEPPEWRLRELENRRDLVQQRDDLSVELCALYNQVGRSEESQQILATRKFQPWEGGEGQALGQYVRTYLALGRDALQHGDSANAIVRFEAALRTPANLGEAKHLLANQSDIYYWLGCAHSARGDAAAARQWWTSAAEARGDFQQMSVRTFSEMTYYSARALEKLGRGPAARKLLRELLDYARELARAPARIDYFATSLPTMLLFEDDLDARQKTTALFLEAQAHHALGDVAAARQLLRKVMKRDPNHALAADLLAALFSSSRKSVREAHPSRLPSPAARPPKPSANSKRAGATPTRARETPALARP